jgi:transcriptional regulator with XRE-family HTH domain
MKKPTRLSDFKRVYITPYISKAIVFYREVRKLTQEQLAEASGLSLSAIKRLEAGRKRGGWATSLEDVCMGLKIKLTELIATADRLAVEAAA